MGFKILGFVHSFGTRTSGGSQFICKPVASIMNLKIAVGKVRALPRPKAITPTLKKWKIQSTFDKCPHAKTRRARGD